jgi:hypothetical protein
MGKSAFIEAHPAQKPVSMRALPHGQGKIWMSTACRLRDHQFCSPRPAVRCRCHCHGEEMGGGGAESAGRSAENLRRVGLAVVRPAGRLSDRNGPHEPIGGPGEIIHPYFVTPALHHSPHGDQHDETDDGNQRQPP